MLDFFRHKYFKFLDRRAGRAVESSNRDAKAALGNASWSAVGRLRVAIIQSGVDRAYERLVSSAKLDNLTFELVPSSDEADCLVFINTIDFSVEVSGKLVILFLHEPSFFMDRYLSVGIFGARKPKQVHIVTHLQDFSRYVALDSIACIHLGIPFINFHNGISYRGLIELCMSTREARRLDRVVIVTSALTGMSGYDRRAFVVNEISNRVVDVDVYGRYTRPMLTVKGYKGPVGLKAETYYQYKFALVVENSMEHGYLSEKVFDALLAGCFPIYVGSEAAFELLPAEWFFKLNPDDPADFDRLKDFLSTVDQDFFSAEQWLIRIDYIFDRCSFGHKLEEVLASR